MKNNIILIGFVVLAMLSSCSVGTKTDLGTGLSYTYNGMSMGSADVVVDGEVVNSNKIALGKTVYIRLNEVAGMTPDANGKVRFGCKIEVTDKSGEVLLSLDDAYQAYDAEGLSPEEASSLNVSLTVGDPLNAGDEYTWSAKFWDKQGSGTINTEMKVAVVETAE